MSTKRNRPFKSDMLKESEAHLNKQKKDNIFKAFISWMCGTDENDGKTSTYRNLKKKFYRDHDEFGRKT